MNKLFKVSLHCLILISILFPFFASAQTQIFQDITIIQRAKVIEVIKEEKDSTLQDAGYGVTSTNQTLSLKIISGEDKGKILTLENDYIVLEKGDTLFIGKDTAESTEYRVIERDRRFSILILCLIFAGVILFFGGKQGLRSLLSLAGGFLMITYVLLPLLVKGYSPILISTTVATVILFIAIYFTHGFNRESTVAFSGTILAVILTGLLAVFSVSLMKLTGFNTEETIFLTISNETQLNFHGILLGGILIGVLGILDDIAITQAAVVSEIYRSANHLSPTEVYKKAIRVGKEHVSALVNTLVLAYTGASLPLLLIVLHSSYPLSVLVSQELFSTEIVRTLVGSIGLVFTVPITTFLAVHFLKDYKGKSSLGHHHAH
jgi:uncharacterized membrane protein